MIEIIKGLSLWQPWASLWAIGAKENETRSWATRYRGLIAIHAAKTDPYLALKGVSTDIRAAMLVALREAGVCPFGKAFKDLPLGAIIGYGELVGCLLMTPELIAKQTPQELLFGDWTPGRYAWEIKNRVLLPVPIPCKGAQGLWTVPPDVADRI
jgi:hypothetical protein